MEVLDAVGIMQPVVGHDLFGLAFAHRVTFFLTMVMIFPDLVTIRLMVAAGSGPGAGACSDLTWAHQNWIRSSTWSMFQYALSLKFWVTCQFLNFQF